MTIFISLHVSYNCSAFGSSNFCVSFSRGRKSERIERNLKHKIRPLRKTWSLSTGFEPPSPRAQPYSKSSYPMICKERPCWVSWGEQELTKILLITLLLVLWFKRSKHQMWPERLLWGQVSVIEFQLILSLWPVSAPIKQSQLVLVLWAKVKFMFSKKTTNFDKIFTVNLTLCVKGAFTNYVCT